jgi:hypothetical protein
VSKVPVSLRFDAELEKRLEKCAEQLHIKKHTLAQMAVEAAVRAIEKNGYKLVIPIEFEVTHEAQPKNSSFYPARKEEYMVMEDSPARKEKRKAG